MFTQKLSSHQLDDEVHVGISKLLDRGNPFAADSKHLLWIKSAGLLDSNDVRNIIRNILGRV